MRTVLVACWSGESQSRLSLVVSAVAMALGMFVALLRPHLIGQPRFGNRNDVPIWAGERVHAEFRLHAAGLLWGSFFVWQTLCPAKTSYMRIMNDLGQSSSRTFLIRFMSSNGTLASRLQSLSAKSV
jgi:hypothetical protein